MNNTRKLKIFFMSLFFIAFVILFGNTSKVHASVIMEVINTTCLNVRSDHNTECSIIGTLKQGDLIEVDKKNSKWAQLSKSTYIIDPETKKYKQLTQTAYCSLDFLKTVPTTQYVTKQSLKVFQEKNTKSNVITTIPKGTKIKVVSTSEPFARLSSGFYCGLKYLKLSTVTRYVTAENLLVRADKSTNSNVITSLGFGTKIKILVTSNTNWAQLSSGGYCARKYLSNKAPTLTMYVYGTTLLNVRSGPGTNYPVKSTLTGGSTVTVTNISNGWAKLSNGNYCSKDYLVTQEQLIEKEKEADKSSNESQKYVNSNHIYFTTTIVNKRKGPGTNYDVVQVLDAFSTFKAVDYINGWFKTSDGCYILGENVAAQISRIDIYLANYSTSNGRILLTCSNGKQMVYPCCGGTREYPTPLGSFSVLLKQKYCTSGLYPSADGKNNMDRSLFFKMENGYAIHCASPYIPSHGCIHVEDSVQEKIFEFTQVGCPVNITQNSLV